MKLFHGPLFIKTCLKKKQICKELFTLRLEDGSEVFIPKDLSLDFLPSSFRYYDPLLQIVQQNLKPLEKDLIT
jgi:hypothetical protein